MGKCYNFVFESAAATGGANNNKRQFITNWSSVLPNNKSFNVRFTYMSETGVLPDANIMCLKSNLGQNTTFTNATPSNSFDTINFMGFLKIQPLAGTVNAYYYADYTTNAPTYLKQRPSGNILEIELHEGTSNVNFTGPIPSDYIITFNFEEVDEY
jgi:hypothetical protein